METPGKGLLPFPIPQSSFYNPHSTILILQSPFYNPHSTIPILQSSFYNPHSTIPILRSSFYNPHSTIPIPQSPFHNPYSPIPAFSKIRQTPAKDAGLCHISSVWRVCNSLVNLFTSFLTEFSQGKTDYS